VLLNQGIHAESSFLVAPEVTRDLNDTFVWDEAKAWLDRWLKVPAEKGEFSPLLRLQLRSVSEVGRPLPPRLATCHMWMWPGRRQHPCA
jgi:hypothetical protein